MAGDALLNAQRLLSDCGVAPGMRVADFGCGRSGHMVMPASLMVGDEGQVYAVDIVPSTLEMLSNHCAQRGILNIDTIWGDYEKRGGVGIEDASLDRIFFVNNLWSVDHFPDVLSEMRRVLKPEGSILVVDWHPRATHPVAPPEEYRTDVMNVMRHLAGSGWKDLNDFRAGDAHWGIRAMGS